MKKLIAILVLIAAPAFSFGMDRLSALSMLETGDDDRMIGKAGEISRYQIMKGEWRKVSKSTAYQNPAVARLVALKIIENRVGRFQQSFHRPPTDYEFYALWNAPAQVMQGKISPVVSERARRFANLCEVDTPQLARVKPALQLAGSL